MTGDTLRRRFEQELNELEAELIRMGGLVEAQLADCLTAISRRDSEKAEALLSRDAGIDKLNLDIDECVVRMLALRQPVAIDLRLVVGSLRIATELERMGDYAANIAKRTVAVNQCPAVEPAIVLQRLGKLVSRMLDDVLNAFSQRDAVLARQAWEADEQVDEIYSSLFKETLVSMTEDPSNITALTHILFMAKSIERIGDHATNIAETVFFMVTGAPLSEARRKADRSSYAVLDPAGLV